MCHSRENGNPQVLQIEFYKPKQYASAFLFFVHL